MQRQERGFEATIERQDAGLHGGCDLFQLLIGKGECERVAHTHFTIAAYSASYILQGKPDLLSYIYRCSRFPCFELKPHTGLKPGLCDTV